MKFKTFLQQGKFKRTVATVLIMIMTMSMLSGCTATENNNESGNNTKTIENLRIMISPYQDADALLTSMKPLADLIKTGMATKGYNIENVDITVGTSYTAVGEALGAGTADVGFISGGTYVTYQDDCDVLLTALREGINKDSLQPSDWNDGTQESFTGNLTTYYRSIILAGPSEKGKMLQTKVNNGEKLTWEDLNSATWAVMGASSASGYIYPSLWLNNQFGKKITDLSSVVQSDSYTTSMARLASGQVDVIVGYAHLRANLGANWTTKFGASEDIYKQTGVIAVTDKILDDTISVSKNSDIVDDAFKNAFADSMIEIGESEEGLNVLKVISHKGYKRAEASDYEAERQAQKMLKESN